MQEEIVTHEYTHGIIKRLCPLNYSGQAGALNESCADVMGLLFRNWLAFQNGQPSFDWTVGSKLADKKMHRDISLCTNTDAFLKLNDEAPTKDNDFGYIHENRNNESCFFLCNLKHATNKS